MKNKCKLAIVPSDILKDKSEEEQGDTKYPAMTALAEKFAILKIPMILDRSKDEKDVLAKYEWSKVYGALFGCEKEASKLYESAAGAHSSDSKRKYRYSGKYRHKRKHRYRIKHGRSSDRPLYKIGG